MAERLITRQDILHVLLHGWREPRKDSFNHATGHWNYAMPGPDISERTLRVIVAVVDRVIVVTAMEIET